MAIIGMFFLGGLVYSAWGGCALCTAFPQRGIEDELCAQRPRRHLQGADAGWDQIPTHMPSCETSQDQSPATAAATDDSGFRC